MMEEAGMTMPRDHAGSRSSAEQSIESLDDSDAGCLCCLDSDIEGAPGVGGGRQRAASGVRGGPVQLRRCTACASGGGAAGAAAPRGGATGTAKSRWQCVTVGGKV